MAKVDFCGKDVVWALKLVLFEKPPYDVIFTPLKMG